MRFDWRSIGYEFLRCDLALKKPTPYPSQEGIFSLRSSFTKFPSWEGTGVGLFQDGFYVH